MKNKKILKIFTILFAAIFIILFTLSIIYQEEIGNLFGAGLGGYGAILLFLIAFLIELIPNYLSPHLGVINAYFLDISLKTTVVFLLLGSITGSILGFELGKKYGTKLTKNFLTERKIRKIENTLNRKGRWGVLFAAISPIPYLPIILGSIKFSRKNFVGFGILPRSVGIVLMTLIVYSFK